MKFSQVALFLVIFASGETNAFLKKLFGGGNNNQIENKVGGRGGKNNNKNQQISNNKPSYSAADDIMNGFSQNGDEGQLKSMITQLAHRSIEDEAKKFEEALVAVMTQRTREYIKVKLGREDEQKVSKIVEMDQFHQIVVENLHEFKTWYTRQMNKRVGDFADQAMEDYYNNVLHPGSKSSEIDDEMGYLDQFQDFGSPSNTQ